jgi:hypothetical protein
MQAHMYARRLDSLPALPTKINHTCPALAAQWPAPGLSQKPQQPVLGAIGSPTQGQEHPHRGTVGLQMLLGCI